MDRPGQTDISPNQRGKQQQIIEAARLVLAREGLAGGTARAVADASPLTKSALHYYFRDINEIIDLAMAAHLDAMLANLRRAADRHDDPSQRLWATVQAYLATFADKPHAAFLWFEYWIAASRRDAAAPAARQLGAVRALLTELLDDLPVRDVGQAAHLLLSWLLGAVVQQDIAPVPADHIQAEFRALLDAVRPADS